MILVPRHTRPSPGQRLVDLVAVPHELIGRALLRRDALDLLAGDLAQPLDHVMRGPVHGCRQRAVTHGGVGPHEDEVIREIWAREAEVRFGLVLPFLGERHPAAAGDGVVRDVTDVEPGRTDDDVEVVVLAVFGVDARGVDGFDVRLCQFDVR